MILQHRQGIILNTKLLISDSLREVDSKIKYSYLRVLNKIPNTILGTFAKKLLQFLDSRIILYCLVFKEA